VRMTAVESTGRAPFGMIDQEVVKAG